MKVSVVTVFRRGWENYTHGQYVSSGCCLSNLIKNRLSCSRNKKSDDDRSVQSIHLLMDGLYWEDLRLAGVTVSKDSRKTTNDTERHCYRQWRSLTAASTAEICWTMIISPDCNLVMSFTVTQLNQLLFQSLSNQYWCFYRNWVSKIYEQWLLNKQKLITLYHEAVSGLSQNSCAADYI